MSPQPHSRARELGDRWLRLLTLMLLLGGGPVVRGEEFDAGIAAHNPSSEDLDMIQDLGVHWTRNDLPWSKVEVVKNKLAMPDAFETCVDGTLRRNMEPLLILDYGNPLYEDGARPITASNMAGFVRYVEFVVQHFKGRVRKYEVWNEWDGTCGMKPNAPGGEPEDYVKLLREVYPRIKAIDPTIEVIGGAIMNSSVQNDYLKRECDAGMLGSLDGFSFHPYGFRPEEGRQPERGVMALVMEVRNLLAKYPRGSDVKLYLTEVGWPTQKGGTGSSRGGVSRGDSARFLIRTMLLMRALPFIKGVWWYDWSDGWNPRDKEANFGVVDYNLTPKPAYFAYRTVNKLLDGASDVELMPQPDEVREIRFKKGGEQNRYALWAVQGLARYEARISIVSNGEPPPLTVDCVRGPFFRDWRSESDSKWSIRLTITEDPVFIDLGSYHSPEIHLVENPLD